MDTQEERFIYLLYSSLNILHISGQGNHKQFMLNLIRVKCAYVNEVNFFIILYN